MPATRPLIYDGGFHRKAETSRLSPAPLSPAGIRITLLKHHEERVRIISLNGRAPQDITAKGWNILTSANCAAHGKCLFVSSYIQPGPVILHMDMQGNA